MDDCRAPEAVIHSSSRMPGPAVVGSMEKPLAGWLAGYILNLSMHSIHGNADRKKETLFCLVQYEEYKTEIIYAANIGILDHETRNEYPP